MRRFVLAALASSALFVAPAFAAYQDDQTYLPPPGPATYGDTLQQIAQLPAFKAQALLDEKYASEKAQPAPMPQLRPAVNYQVPGVPNYLPMTRMDAQNAPGMYGPADTASQPTGYVQQAAFIQQGDASAASAQPANPPPTGYSQQAQNSAGYQSNYQTATPSTMPQSASPLLAQDPVAVAQPYQPQYPSQYMPAAPVPAPLPAPAMSAPVVAAPLAPAAPVLAAPAPVVQAPAPVAMIPAPVAPAPVVVPGPLPVAPGPMQMADSTPSTGYAGQVPAQYSAPMTSVSPPVGGAMPSDPAYTNPAYNDMGMQVSQPYNPPTMQGNPTYEYIDAPRPPRPSYAMEPAGREGFYGSLLSGITFGDDTSFKTSGGTYTNDYHTGWALLGGVGYSFKPLNSWMAPRMSGEFGTVRQSVAKQIVGTTEFKDPNGFGDTDTLTGLVNGYVDFMPYAKTFVPYVGGGIGFGYVDFDRHGVTAPVMSHANLGFAWDAAAGLGITLARGSVLDVGYRYLQTPSVDLKALDGTTSSTSVGAHIITLGYRQSF